MPRKYFALRALDDRSWTRAFIFWLGVALVLHLLAAVFSVGYYHTDEHFQILEFLNYKLGRSSGSDLAIEFSAKLRPWFHPGLYFLLTRAMQALGLKRPFQWVFIFRLISSLLGWLSLVGLSLLSYSWFEDPRLRKIALILAGCLWYLPALHARQSSESLSGSFFYIAASVLFLFIEADSSLFHLAVGLLFGAAFLFRYQIAFLILGAGLYFLLRYRPAFRKLAMLALGVILMIGIGILVDHWGYGAWTFTPWNYFRYNIVQNHVADVDTQPVYDFFTKTWTETFPPLGFLTLSTALLGWVLCPLHLLTAITLPLYLIHSIIGHKELRFIFPIAFAGPFLILLALSAKSRAGGVWRKFWWSKAGTLTRRTAFAINLIALLPSTMLPVWAPALFFEQVYRIKQTDLPHEPMVILYKDKNPLEILGIPLGFYRPDETTSSAISSYNELNRRIEHSNKPVWFFEVGFRLPGESGKARMNCRPVAESLPKMIASIVRWRPLRPVTHRVTNWILYRCSRSL